MKAAEEMGMELAAEGGEEKKVIPMEQPEGKGSKAAEESGEEADDEVDMYVKFSKPYVFEDDTYNGLDMSCLENLTTDDLTEIEKKFYKQGIASFNPENTATYAKIVAWKATGLPIEFFNQLPIKDMLKIKSRVVNFFYN
ncbi:MAG: phage tail assembly protein [Lachnospira sp.]|nr:phage tail assembly protein [Lachnospira sp.]